VELKKETIGYSQSFGVFIIYLVTIPFDPTSKALITNIQDG